MVTTVCVSNCIGLVLMAMLLITDREQFRKDSRTEKLLWMICVTVFSCIADMIAFAADGRPGIAETVLLYIVNSWLFLAVIMVFYFWMRLEYDFMGAEVSKKGKAIISVVNGVGILLLVINLFYPLVFSLENNVYRRESLYWVFVLIGAFNAVYGLRFHYSYIKKVRSLISFPISAFFIPITVAVVIQSLYYGISVIWVGIAFAIQGVSSSLKNTLIYMDQLTRVYNRYYLETFSSGIRERDTDGLTGIMADINDFKKINDTIGHDAGDDALVAVAGIFSEAVRDIGQVIRYGGDEFVILIESEDGEVVSGVVEAIRRGCMEFNERGEAPFKLSVSMGYRPYTDRTQAFDDYLKDIDALMYEQKQEYHRLHGSSR